jgi:CubicO group peptidase (beta-lactamase class C family)
MSVTPQLPSNSLVSIRGLPRSTPELQGVDSAHLGELLKVITAQIHDVHSIMVLRHGHVILEGWRSPFAPEIPHQLFSLSKSFTATAVGIAVAEGLLSVDDLVTALLPDDLPDVVSDHLAVLTVEHLLTMTTGHALDTIGGPRISASVSVDSMQHVSLEEDTGASANGGANGGANDSSDAGNWGDNWAREILAIPLEFAPGTQFVYNSGATYLLAAILTKITGERLLDYLTPRLFGPLGIAGATWQQCPRGIDIGAYGLSLTTEDVAAFGQLYLQNGLWRGQQLVPSAWVHAASAAQVRNDSPAPSPLARSPLTPTKPTAEVFPDKIQGYGYQFWRGLHNSYRGDGAFGQYCIVAPDHDVVVVYTSGVLDMQALLALTWEHLIPAISPVSVGALPENDVAHSRLQALAAGLVVPLPAAEVSGVAAPAGGADTTGGVDASGVAFERGINPAAEILGTRYTVAPDRLGVDFEVDITEFTLRDTGGTTILELSDSLGGREIVCRNDASANSDRTASGWTTDAVMPMGGRPTPVAVAAVWLSERVWRLRLQYVETPYALTLTFRFSADDATRDAATATATADADDASATTTDDSSPATRAVTIEATQNVAFGATALGTLHGSAVESINGPTNGSPDGSPDGSTNGAKP